MKYVLDSSVAAKWVLAEHHDAKARQLRFDFLQGVHELLAPDVFTTELTHLLTRAERQGRLSIGEASIHWADVLSTPPQMFASLPLTSRAISVSSQMRIGVYDCLYVALAECEQCQLITADDRLVRNLQPTFPFIVHLSTY